MKKITSLILSILILTGNLYSVYAESDIFSVSAESKTISWKYSDEDYSGANIYSVDENGKAVFCGTTSEYSFECPDYGTYIVRRITDSGESHGKSITLSDNMPLSVAVNSINVTDKSISCNVEVTNNSTKYVSGVTAFRIINGDKINNYAYCKINLASGEADRFYTSLELRGDFSSIEAIVWDSKDSRNPLSEKITFDYTETYAVNLSAELDRKASELYTLISECNAKGISTDYEIINYRVIDRFSDYVLDDVSDGDLSRIFYTAESTDKLYKEAKENLESYLNGSKKAISVPEYVTSDISVDGQTMYAATEINGVEEIRPVFFVGYGHFQSAKNDIPVFHEFGANTIQNEIGPDNVMKKEAGWRKAVQNNANAAAERESDCFSEGEYSLKITYDDELLSNRYLTLWQTVSVEPGKTYILSGDAKANNANKVWISANDYSDRYNLNGTYDWNGFSTEFTAGEDQTSTVVRILAEDVIDEFYIDGISFKEKGSEKDLLSDGGFENFGEKVVYEFNPDSDKLRELLQMLEDAEENNIAVSLLLSPHYFMSDVISEYGIEYSDGAFLKYNVNAPIARKNIEKYLRGIIPLIKDYDSINNIVISNEPHFHSKELPEFYTPIWQNWLSEKYNGNINTLNAAYKTSYASFDEVDYNISISNMPKYYDYKLFNDEIFGEWHKFMADIVHELAPEIPVNTKITGYTSSKKQSTYLINGTGYEEYYEYLDYNGCDFWNCIDDSLEPLVKEMWYDYMLSFKDVPIINSEDHIITDKSKVYTPEVADYAAQDIYQGAIHGRAMSDIWVWERSTNTESSLRDSILYRPDAIKAVGYAANDLNRLSEEITALQRTPATVGIIYSNADMMFNDNSMHAAYEAYEAALFNGQKVRFVLDINPEAIHNYKLIIVPDTKYVSEKTLTELKKYIDNGGKVMIMGEGSLLENETGEAHKTNIPEHIISNSEVVNYSGTTSNMTSWTKPEFCEIVRNSLIDAGLYNVKVIDSETGEPVHYIEYNTAVYNGNIIINLANFSDTKSVKIYVDGEEMTSCTELRSNIEYGNVVTVGKYQSVTLRTNIE